MTVAEAKTLLPVQQRTGVIIGEAFMVRTHPQWLRARELVASGRIGSLRSIQGFFSYFNTDPKNIRNIPECGGGGLMDIGCYPINTSRFLFGEEPLRVSALLEKDPKLQVDRLTSAVMEFPSGHATFTCSTQLVPYQRMQIFGTKGRIEIEIPFNAPNDRPCRILIDDGHDLIGGGITVESFPTCDQYTIQGDAFSRAVREGTPAPVPLADAIKNMAVIEAIFRSADNRVRGKPRKVSEHAGHYVTVSDRNPMAALAGRIFVFRRLIPGFGVAYFPLQILGREMRFIEGFSSRVGQVPAMRRWKLRCLWIAHAPLLPRIRA